MMRVEFSPALGRDDDPALYAALAERSRRLRHRYAMWMGVNHIYSESRETWARFLAEEQLSLLEEIAAELRAKGAAQ